MVEKITKKDKNYNMHVSNVTIKENKIEIIRKDILCLEEQCMKLKNDCNIIFFNLVSDEQKDDKNQGIKHGIYMQEDEENLIAEENSLLFELKQIQEKHKNIKLVYQKVNDNIKGICKLEKYYKKIEENSFSGVLLNHSRDSINDLDNSKNIKRNYNDEDLTKAFQEYLIITKKSLENAFLKTEKKDYLQMIKEKGDIMKEIKSPSRINKEKVKDNRLKKVEKNRSKESNSMKVNSYNEYDYSDDELKEDDKNLKEEYEAIAAHFRKVVRINY